MAVITKKNKNAKDWFLAILRFMLSWSVKRGNRKIRPVIEIVNNNHCYNDDSEDDDVSL